MNKSLVLKIVMALGVLQLIVEILFLDFDDLSGSLKPSKIVSILIPVLIIIGMWLYLKEIKKEASE